jgi:hypothetical protein
MLGAKTQLGINHDIMEDYGISTRVFGAATARYRSIIKELVHLRLGTHNKLEASRAFKTGQEDVNQVEDLSCWITCVFGGKLALVELVECHRDGAGTGLWVHNRNWTLRKSFTSCYRTKMWI